MQHHKGLVYRVGSKFVFPPPRTERRTIESNVGRILLLFLLFLWFELLFCRGFLFLTLFDGTFSSCTVAFYFLQSKSGMFQLEFISNDENSLEIFKTIPLRLQGGLIFIFIYLFFFFRFVENKPPLLLRHFRNAKYPEKSCPFFFFFFSVMCTV